MLFQLALFYLGITLNFHPYVISSQEHLVYSNRSIMHATIKNTHYMYSASNDEILLVGENIRDTMFDITSGHPR